MRRFVTIALIAIGLLGACAPFQKESTAQLEITGQVISLNGTPVGGATVLTHSTQTTTDASGYFRVVAEQGAQWVTVRHASFLSRTRAASPGAPVLIRLTPDDGETISLNFAGDTMFGRRFYDPNEDGNLSDGLLRPGAGVSQHLALLQHAQPLLENADLTAVNLETPLTAEPYVDPIQPRPAVFHPTKDYAFSSDPASAAALKAAGVDVVDLGNNHLYDALEQGVANTQRAVREAGLASFGAGMSESEAWSPAVVTARGSAVAFIGCTSITGSEHPISYVASDAQHKAGAASCSAQAIRQAVAAARAKYPIVVMMIHGGYEYVRTPSETIRNLTAAAREAGATLVINHHPHVVGGFDWNGTSLVGWTLGNFLFDQTVWPTLESYLLTVQVRRGQVIRAYVEPLIIDGFVPKGVAGDQADYVARAAAGQEPGPFVIENGAMEVDIQRAATQRQATATIDSTTAAGTIVRMPSGWWASGFAGPGTIRLGRDLLWAGTFEDESVDTQHHSGALWELEDSDQQIGPDYAYASDAGIRLRRNASDYGDSLLTHIYRILIEPGRQITVAGMVRASPNAHVSLQIGWYNATRGPSDTQSLTPIQIRQAEEWMPFQVEATAPPKAIAVGIFVRLQAPSRGNVTADFDNIRLIEWMPPSTPFSQLYDHVRIVGSGDLTLHSAALPGAEAWATPPELDAFGQPEPIKTRGGQ